MKAENKFEKWKIKYPDIFEGNQVSLHRAGNMFNVYNLLKKDNDLQLLQILGIEDFGEDIKFILEPNRLKRIRREKLDKINGKQKDT